MFWWLGFHVVPLVGSAVSVWVVRITTLAVLVLVGIPTGESLPLPRGNIWWILLVVGLMDTCAFVANNAGMGTGSCRRRQRACVALRRGHGVALLDFLRERIERSQWFGIFLIFVGVVLVSL